MRTAAAEDPHIRHATPGRVRIHWSGWSGQGGQALEARLLRLPGVRSARASSLTRNILIHFDPQQTHERALLAALTSICPDLVGRFRGEGRFPAPQKLARRPLPPSPLAAPNGRPPGPLRMQVVFRRRSAATGSLFRGVQRGSRHASEALPGSAVRGVVAALRLGRLAMPYLADWKVAVAGLEMLAGVADVLGTLQTLSPIRRVPPILVGRNPGALLGSLTEALAALLAGNFLALALSIAETCFQLTRPRTLPLLRA